MLGQLFGNYRLVDLLGRGGMGEVFLGEHELLGSRAAVKLLAPHLTHNREALERFFREAKVTSRIDHPGIVQIFDYGRDEDGRWFIIMEYLEGENLQERLRRVGALRWATAVELGRQIASALAAAHAEGVVHRDLKPANVFIVGDPDMPGGERIKLLDFGIAKLTEGGTRTNTDLTQTGAVIGTPAYMSPEQCRGLGTDDRSDVYTLGCLLFRCISGESPFVAESAGDYIIAHATRDPPRLDAVLPGVPGPLADLIAHTLAKGSEQRPAAATVKTRLEALRGPVAATEVRPAPEPDTTVAEAFTRVTPASTPVAATLPDPRRDDGEVAATRARVDQVLAQLEPTAPPLAQLPRRVDVTTLGSASGQTLSPPPRNNLVVAAVALGTVALVVLVSVLLAGQGTEPSERAEVAASGDATPPENPVASPADAGARIADASVAAVVFDAALAPPPDAAPTTRAVSVITRPRGATVRLSRDGEAVGETPLTLEVPRGEPTKVWLSLRGYRGRVATIGAGDPGLRVSLRPRKSGGGKGGSDDPLGHR